MGDQRDISQRSRSRDVDGGGGGVVLKARNPSPVGSPASPARQDDRGRSPRGYHRPEGRVADGCEPEEEEEPGAVEPHGKRGTSEAESGSNRPAPPREKADAGYGYGAAKPPAEKKSKAAVPAGGYGYGASKLLNTEEDGSESSSEYTSEDDSSDEGDSSNDSEDEPRLNGGCHTDLATSGPKLHSRQELALNSPVRESPFASPASSSCSSRSQHSRVSEELKRKTLEPRGDAQAPNGQSWIARADGERPRVRHKSSKTDGGSNKDLGNLGEKEDGNGFPAMDPYMEAALAREQVAASEAKKQTPDAEEPHGDSAGQVAANAATVDPYLLDVGAAALVAGQADGAAGVPTKRKRWRRRVCWRPPPPLDLPDNEDVPIDLERSMDSLASRARREQRGQQLVGNVQLATDHAGAQPPRSGSGYISKCTELMNELEAGAEIASTVLDFWGRLDAAERARFSTEFPEFLRYIK